MAITKENALFTIIGLLAGAMIGFFVANSINTSVAITNMGSSQPAAGLPSGHPNVPSGNGEGGAIPEVQAAIENARQNPTDFEAQMKAAELFYQIQRFDGATEFLKKANEIQPENYEVVVNLGNASFDAEKYEEAEKWYSTALAKKQDDRDVRTDLGLTFVFRPKPDYDRAITEFKRVLEDDPGHKQALQNLTVAYTKKEDAANANLTAERLEKVDPTNSSLAKLREDIGKIGKK
ncbi:MAG: tetratricopeptide repeat protein [Acidobacteriota bacterium]